MQQYFQKMQNRGPLSPDGRPLKRTLKHRSQTGGTDKSGAASSSAILFPDVYPQQEKQEEDVLTVDRLVKGYQIEVIHRGIVQHEYDNFNANTLRNSKTFLTEDQLFRAVKWIKQLVQKKSELNLIMLDRNWIKENNVRGSFISDGFREEFFESLATGRRMKDSKRHSLAVNFPRFLRATYDQLTSLSAQKSVPLCEAMNLLYEKAVPIQKAIWFLKMNQVAQPILITNNKQKKGTSVSCDDYASDQRQFFIRYMRCLLKEFDKAIPGQLEQNHYYQRWPYYAALIKHSFEDGMLERHEFLLDMCDLLAEFSQFSLEQPQTFRILIILMSQFTDVITQNVFIARRVAHILCHRLAQYRRDYDKMRSPTSPAAGSTQTPSNVCFEELTNCQHHRPTLLVLFGLLHAIIIDCPTALVWTPFEPADLLEGSKSLKLSKALERENALQSVAWLCASPLDHLPCKIEVTTQHLTKPDREPIAKLLFERIKEIKERSRFVESHWAYINPSNAQAGIEIIVESCLEIISFMDNVALDQPKALEILYENIFPKEEKEPPEISLDIRIRMLIQWAVSSEREGTHRALIVAQLIKQLTKTHQQFGPFKSLQELLIHCVNRDWAPQLFCGKKMKEKLEDKRDRQNVEFANLLQLFYEFHRFGLFSHDQYVRQMMRNGAFGQEPLCQRLKAAAQGRQQQAEQSAHKAVNKQPEQAAQVKESQMIISFIPTTPSIPPSLNVTGSAQQKSEEFAKLLPEYEKDQHLYLDNNSPDLSFHDQFLLHLPIEQLEANRDACNQRAIVLYGISEQREQAKQEMRKIAREICKTWKKLSIEIAQQSPNSPVRELRYRRRLSAEQLAEVMGRFRTQTHYDQLVICGWCAESFVDCIEEFLAQLQAVAVEGSAQQNLPAFPTAECLDMLCEMITTCKNMHSLVTLAAEVLPFLVEIERVFRQSQQKFHIDCIPGLLTTQLAYVLISRLADNFYYFLYSPEACPIFNNLYSLIQWDLRTAQQKTSADSGAFTGWSRAIAMFILHGRDKLLSAEQHIREDGTICTLLGTFEELTAVYPASGAGALAKNMNYCENTMLDMLNQAASLGNSRFLSLHELKTRLQSMQNNEHAKYSFVVNAFRAANACGRDYDRLVELSNFCAHVSTSLGLETEWCTAIQELCYSNVSNNTNWNDMLMNIDPSNFTTHYALSTFVLLLVSKYAISAHGLICRLVANVFHVILREEGGFQTDNFENGVCLAIYICTALICGKDVPFICTEINPKIEVISRQDCNQLALRIVHIAELGFVVFPLLSVIMQLVDELKRKVQQESSKKETANLQKFSEQLAIARCALLSMCEQEWVIQRMFELCASDNEMENFINSARLKNHSIGLQLLRIALRRKRRVKQELMECTDTTVYEKLLSALSIWNMRATYFDFKLKINDTFPISQMAKLSNGNPELMTHYQMIMYLFISISTACHQLFLTKLTNKEKKDEEEIMMTATDFRPSAINSYWLIASLAAAMPSPPPPTGMTYQQSNFWCSWNCSAIKAHFLRVVAENLKLTADGKNKSQEEPVKYEQLLAYQPFLNLVMACTEGEDLKQLVDTLLEYIDDIVGRVKKNPIIPHQTAFLPEREGLILRLNLITGLFDTLTTNSNAEQWASALFQLLYYEILTYERDPDYFDTCMDMLVVLCHKMYPHRVYNTFVGKFKNLRIPDSLFCLQQLLPVPKSQAEMSAWDYFSNSIGKGSSSSTSTGAQGQQQIQPCLPVWKQQIHAVIIDKQPVAIEKKILRMLKHEHWMQKHTDVNTCKMLITFITRPGLPGEEKLLRPDPFLAPPEMEQVPILQEISGEQNRQNMEQQQFQQQQAVQQRIHQQQQQQQSAMEQQYKQQLEAEHQMRAFQAHQQQQQQQQMKLEQQQQAQIMGGPQQNAQMGQPGGMLPPAAQQFQQQQQQMLQQQQQMMGHGPETGVPGPFPTGQPQPPILNLLQQQSRGSGSSTPAGTTDSPARTVGAGRGGRRKSGAGQQPAAGSTGAGRGQKRKKEPKQPQQQQQQAQPHPMLGAGGSMEMFTAMGGGPPGPGMGGGQPGQQMPMGHAAMMMQQQQQQQQMAQMQQWQQMQRQQQQQGQQQQGQGQQMMGGPPMMFNQPPQQSHQQQPTQFRPQMPQQPPPQYQQPQQPQMTQGRFTGGGGQPMQMGGMMGSGQMQQPPQQQQQMSDIKKTINQKLMQKKQNQQAQQQQQHQHPGMGGMGMPP